MLTLKGILANTPRVNLLAAKDVVVGQMQKKVNAKTGFKRVSAVTYTATDPKGYNIPKPKKYTSVVTQISDKNHVEVSCTCDNFWSTWEVALHAKGAARIRFSNGEMPNIRNPRMIAGCCKHLVALINKMGVR
jgi:hypothetical protein